MESSVKVKIGDVLKETCVTIRLVGRLRFAAMLWLGTRIMKLGAMIAGFGMRMDKRTSNVPPL